MKLSANRAFEVMLQCFSWVVKLLLIILPSRFIFYISKEMPKSLKILMFITDLNIGGGQKIVAQIANGLDRKKYEVSVACLFGAGFWAEQLRNNGIVVENLEMRGKFDFGAVSRLSSLLRKSEIQLINTHLFHANQLGTLTSKLVRVPVIISTRHNVVIGGRHRDAINRLLAPLRDFSIAVSESVKLTEIEKSHTNPKKISTISNGIDTREYLHSDEGRVATLKKEFGLTNDDSVVVFVGRIVPQKGINILLKAASYLVTEYQNLKILLVGGGSSEPEARRLVTEYGLENSVIFGGFRSEISEILAIGDIFVLPSLWEGLPLGIIEAMSAGKPVVATRVGGVPEIVVDGETGLLVPAGNHVALGDALAQLLVDRELAIQIGEAGRKRAIEHFDIRKTVKKTEALYDRLIKEKLGLVYREELGWVNAQ